MIVGGNGMRTKTGENVENTENIVPAEKKKNKN